MGGKLTLAPFVRQGVPATWARGGEGSAGRRVEGRIWEILEQPQLIIVGDFPPSI